jgi:mannose-6-phosphate isomerase
MPIELSLYPLKGKVQHYTWGGIEFIPQLLNIKNENKAPFAEYWLGSHPNHPGTIRSDNYDTSLFDFIVQHKREVLGEEVVQKFDTLPYLLKVLDVRQMLSIQVHPDKDSARESFKKENNLGIPLTAPHRNYKDTNHKPELMVALSDFWLLHGFKPVPQLKEVLSSLPDFNFLLDSFEEGGYEGLYKKVMTMEQHQVNEILEPLITQILPLYHNGELLKNEEAFWVARAAETFCKNGQYDRGIFSIYFFNLLHLQKGEGIYQAARLPHAYLEGQNIEVMANSDNVLRAGLTDKHIDVPELMKHVQFEETIPVILKGGDGGKETVYKSPAAEFLLKKGALQENETISFHTKSAEILFVLEGDIQLTVNEQQWNLKRGEAAFIIADTTVTGMGLAPTIFFKVEVPLEGKN